MENKLKRFIFIFIVLLAFTSTSYAKDDLVYDEAERTIKSLNEIRKNSDLKEFVINDTLKEMATSHSKYMDYNKTASIVEDRSKDYYKGRYPWDRANYFKYRGRYVYEFTVEGINNFDAGISDIITDPVTRSILLNPIYGDIAMSIEGGYASFVVGGNNEVDKESFVVYPYDGQKDVKSQNDLAHFTTYFKKKNVVTDYKVGMPITITYYGSKMQNISDLKVKIKNVDNDKEINYVVLKPSDYGLLYNNSTLLILPTERYDYDSEYELSIKFKTELKNNKKRTFNRKISFRTDSFGKEKVEDEYINRGEFVKELVSHEKYDLIEPLEYKFSDVKVSDNLSKYIYTATSKNLISGFPDGRFEPKLNINKEQVYTIMIKAYELKANGEVYVDRKSIENYDDYDEISPWAVMSIAKADKLGIVLKDGNRIKPKDYLTVDEYKEILERFSKVKKTGYIPKYSYRKFGFR